ncbi:MAG TPA: hypothetical protein P5149_03895 [Candidatus Competibacteraceae bacterium]|nr:hypothetical protein [Candidatus Competibacteraceae bacterium]MCP5134573.1 hypothetical protein [Gammaproteobacteria bacterium]HPF58470.1 hypothetical protein [Candidatus Competibacteraceae bacterium]HRY17525.1 hypothetical protein [Candidatus Competibacteraceae bacterium]
MITPLKKPQHVKAYAGAASETIAIGLARYFSDHRCRCIGQRRHWSSACVRCWADSEELRQARDALSVLLTDKTGELAWLQSMLGDKPGKYPAA